MSELNKQLQAIFISKVVLANVKEIMIPHFWWKKDRIQEQRRAELDEMAKQERLDEYAALGEEPPEEEEVVSRDISPAERELELDEYHHMLGHSVSMSEPAATEYVQRPASASVVPPSPPSLKPLQTGNRVSSSPSRRILVEGLG